MVPVVDVSVFVFNLSVGERRSAATTRLCHPLHAGRGGCRHIANRGRTGRHLCSEYQVARAQSQGCVRSWRHL